MKLFFLKSLCALIILFSTFFRAQAQFKAVYIGVNGLTCSQCTRTVEMRLRKLDFVDDVQMNLQHTEGTITLKENKKADMEKIAQAVFDAGFSVRYLQADLNVDKSVHASGQCFNYNGDEYVFEKAPKEPVTGTIKLKFIGKKFMSKSEFKKMQQHIDAPCGSAAGKVYHVMLS